jgi:hypothetical protein
MSELKEFVFRGQVRALYRQFLRVTRQAPEGARGGQFAMLADCTVVMDYLLTLA